MFFKALKHFLGKFKWVIAFALIAIAGVASLYVYKQMQPPEYTMMVSLVYQDASNGLTPSGTRYNPYFMISDEILSPIEEEIGESLDRKVWIRSSPSMSGKSIATEYIIHCKGVADPEYVLRRIQENYTAYFEEHYTMNESVLVYNQPDKDMDYLEYVDYLSTELSKITTFINKRIKLDGSWYSEDGTSYQDVYEYGQNIENIDIANLRAYIVRIGLSKEAKEIKNEYAYKNLLLSIDMDKATRQYENRREAIDIYDQTLFPTISVPSIKDGEYYVTTTKTGLDDIYDAASSFSETAYKLKLSISKNEMEVERMFVSRTSKTTDDAIKGIEDKILNLIEWTKEVNDNYTNETRTQYLVFGKIRRAN